MTPGEMTRHATYHVTVKRPGRRRYTYRYVEMYARDLQDPVLPWVAIHQAHRNRGAVLVAREIVHIEEA